MENVLVIRIVLSKAFLLNAYIIKFGQEITKFQEKM